MTFSIGGKLVGGLLTATSVSATVAAPYVPKLIDKYILAGSSSYSESFSSDSPYSEESEVIVSDEVISQNIPAVEVKLTTSADKPVYDHSNVKAYTVSEKAKALDNTQLKENQDAYDKIQNWINQQNSCKISFMIKASEKSVLDFEKINKNEMKDDSIFSKDKALNKSKFSAFADQLNSKDGITSSYIKRLVENCKSIPSQILYLHWRGMNITEAKMVEFRGIKNVWVDHKSLFENSTGFVRGR